MPVQDLFPSRLILLILVVFVILYTSTAVINRVSANESLLHSYFGQLPITQPEQDNALTSPSLEYIPRIIHQIYKDKDIPSIWKPPHESCLSKNPQPNWTHILWTDQTARDFIQNSYPWFLATYDAYPYGVQRVDSLRYFVLNHHGGIYLDLDVGCARDLSPLLTQRAFFGKTEPYGVSNDVMGAEKGHPVFRSLITALEANKHRRGTKYPTVMMSTGPMFVTMVLIDYLRTQNSEKILGGSGESNLSSPVTILPPSLYASSPESYFQHYPGSTWHSWDVEILSTVNDNPFHFLVGISFLVWIYLRRKRRTRRVSF